jgi:myo-inositol-1-phosphate synthase
MGTTCGDVLLNCEVRREVWDSPNSAGVAIDPVRYARLVPDRGGGTPIGPFGHVMQSLPRQFADDAARQPAERRIRAEAL